MLQDVQNTPHRQRTSSHTGCIDTVSPSYATEDMSVLKTPERHRSSVRNQQRVARENSPTTPRRRRQIALSASYSGSSIAVHTEESQSQFTPPVYSSDNLSVGVSSGHGISHFFLTQVSVPDAIAFVH